MKRDWLPRVTLKPGFDDIIFAIIVGAILVGFLRIIWFVTR